MPPQIRRAPDGGVVTPQSGAGATDWAAAMMAAMSQPITGDTDSGTVWWGDVPEGYGIKGTPFRQQWHRPGYGNGVLAPQPSTPKSTTTKTGDEAALAFFEWDTTQRRKWGEYLVSIGWLEDDEVNDFAKLKQAWDTSVAIGVEFNKAGKHKVNPWQAAAMYTGEDGAGKTKASRTRTYTQKSVDLTTAEGAKALLDNAMAKYLGRAANAEEVTAFLGKLNEAQRANPLTSTTTTTTDKDGVATSSTQQSGGGVVADEFAKGQVMKLPEHTAYQAGVTYANALFDAIRSPV